MLADKSTKRAGDLRVGDQLLPPEPVASFSVEAALDALEFKAPGFHALIPTPRASREVDPHGWAMVDNAAMKAVGDLVTAYIHRQPILATFSTAGAAGALKAQRDSAFRDALVSPLQMVALLIDMLEANPPVVRALQRLQESLRLAAETATNG